MCSDIGNLVASLHAVDAMQVPGQAFPGTTFLHALVYDVCANVGAGACALPMAIRHHFPRATIDAVDIDAEALDLAQCFFGAEEDAHLLMHNDDGVKFLTKHGVASKVSCIS